MFDGKDGLKVSNPVENATPTARPSIFTILFSNHLISNDPEK